MNDAFMVDRSQTFADVEGDRQRVLPRQRTGLFDPAGQCKAVEIFHGQECGGGIAPYRWKHEEFVDAANVGSGNFSGQLDFTAKAVERRSGGGEIGSNRLEGDAAELEVVGFEHLAHPTPAEKTNNPESSKNDFARSKGSFYKVRSRA